MLQLTGENEPPSPHLFRRLAARGCGPVTLSLLVVCAGLFIYGYFFGYRKISYLCLTNFDFTNAGEISLWRGFRERVGAITQLLPEVRRGQVWRLVSPMMVHVNFLQLFINLLALWWLGNTIEMRKGSLRLFGLTLALGLVCNLTIYLIDGVGFGGMSGVVYGLAGYAWACGKFDPRSRLSIHFFTMTMMGVWALFCLVGILGPIVNAAHISGLLAGLAWGFFSAPGSIGAKLSGNPPIRLSADPR